jgi:hypothetical protein
MFLDLFPPLRALPDVLLKTRAHAKELHDIELKFHKGNWMDVKKKLKAGTAKVSTLIHLHYPF